MYEVNTHTRMHARMHAHTCKTISLMDSSTWLRSHLSWLHSIDTEIQTGLTVSFDCVEIVSNGLKPSRRTVTFTLPKLCKVGILGPVSI